MNVELKNFINKNIDLINLNTKNSWEEIYQQLNIISGKYKDFIGKFTEVMLLANIDPAEILGYIPDYYLMLTEIKHYTIPESATSIGEAAFANCWKLTDLVIPGNIKNIGNRAFQDCQRLAAIDIPDSLLNIGNYVFNNCENLANITFGNNITNISEGAFNDCSKLVRVHIPGSVDQIKQYAFQNCKNLTTVVIENGVKAIKAFSFNKCYSLKNITIPKTIQSIDSFAFRNCYIPEVNFNGTRADAIKLELIDKSKNSWVKNSSTNKLICTDGEIEL